MRHERMSGLRRLLVAITIVAAVAGCAGQPRAAREGAVVVAKTERAIWNAPPEDGLFRVVFDAQLAGEIRRRAEATSSQEDMGYIHAEIRVLEGEAQRELKARGLCEANVKLVHRLDEGGGPGTLGAIFKCRASLF